MRWSRRLWPSTIRLPRSLSLLSCDAVSLLHRRACVTASALIAREFLAVAIACRLSLVSNTERSRLTSLTGASVGMMRIRLRRPFGRTAVTTPAPCNVPDGGDLGGAAGLDRLDLAGDAPLRAARRASPRAADRLRSAAPTTRAGCDRGWHGVEPRRSAPPRRTTRQRPHRRPRQRFIGRLDLRRPLHRARRTRQRLRPPRTRRRPRPSRRTLSS